ncbi:MULTISPECIES: nitroreductase family protein [Nocardiopsis]|uniref:hypothetical protein n=1 Tax=Nocardiopsis TaxID=2013 RepID=UPI001D036A18|nr:hypothetical protein [Nocardiopsis sinuspersici]
MGTTRPGPPGTAPLPVTGPRPPATDSRARVLAGFHGQSHDKDVSPVETLFFGPDLSNGLARPVPGQARPSLPALGPLRDTNASGPPLGGPWSRAQRLLAACVEAVRVRRISAADRYPVHRAYPSPRGLFGADLFVVSGGPVPRCLRVDPQSHALQPLDGLPAPREPEDLADARLVVAVDHRRYPPEYGRLRPSLALLEGGHLLATLGLALERAGLRPRTHFGPTDTPVPSGFSPCGAITLEPDGTSDADGAGEAPEAGSAPETEGTTEAGGTPETEGTTKAGGTPKVSGAPETEGATEPDGFPEADGTPTDTAPTVSAEALSRVAAASAPTGTALRRWLDDRTSGVSTANLVTSSHVGPGGGEGVSTALAAALGAAGEALPVPGALRLYRKVLVADRVDDRAACELVPDGTELPSRPVARTGETNFSSSLGYTLAVDFRPWARAHGDHAQTVLHTLLGWTAQWGCLGAAATGLCARPMRNYQEADWAAVLGLGPDQTPAYQLWVRAERGSYMDLPVDASP